MKSLRIVVLISLIVLVACDYDRYEKVHVKVFFAEMEPFEAQVNYLDIYEDRIELIKWLVDKKGDGRYVVLVFEKSEYDSLWFQHIFNQ